MVPFHILLQLLYRIDKEICQGALYTPHFNLTLHVRHHLCQANMTLWESNLPLWFHSCYSYNQIKQTYLYVVTCFSNSNFTNYELFLELRLNFNL